jgi:transposase
MNQRTKLKAWMTEKGYSNRQLAQELGFSYEYIYKLAISHEKPITDSFKYRFIERFGWQEASQVFDGVPAPESATELA